MSKLYVITNPVPTHNNSPLISLGKFLRVILRAGHPPTVIGARISEDGIPGVGDAVPVINYSYGGRGIAKTASYLLLQLRTFFSGLARFRKGDAVYFWIADKMIGSFLAAKLRGAETSFFLYGRIFGGKGAAVSDKLVLYMANRATHVCVESPSVFNQWSTDVRKTPDSIQLYVPEPKAEPIPFECRDMTVAMFCRLCGGKHIDDSIRAFCALHREMPEYSLKIIGGGILEAELRGLIKELDAEEYITVTGWLEPAEALAELARCRVLLYPTDGEGVPGSVLEAMALGVIPLASPAGGIPDIVDDGVTGVHLTATDSETICRELADLLRGSGLKEMSAAAEEKIRSEFSLDSAAANFKSVWESHK